MSNEPQITDTYDVDGDLRKQLDELQNSGRITGLQKRKVELADGLSAHRILCKVTFAGMTAIRFETVSPLGLFSSHHGNQGMIAALTLATSLQYGEPTLIYNDHVALGQHGQDSLDLTAEWYHDPLVKKRIPEKRMEFRSDIFEAEDISLETLEERAKRWFASH